VTPERLDEILSRFADLRIAVLGDVFLDKYLDLDRSLSERSLETGREAYQAVQVRCYPGAGGNVAKNLTALGVGKVAVITVIGVDGEGFDLKNAMARYGIDMQWVIESPDRFTPTYTKPMLHEPGRKPYEIERIDIKNRQPLPASLEQKVIETLRSHIDELDGVIVADQVQERNCGVVTDNVRELLSELAQQHPEKVFFADSRCRIAEFRSVIIKPNRFEAAAAIGIEPPDRATRAELAEGGRKLSNMTGRPVFVTLGEEGLMVIQLGSEEFVPAYRVTGEIDIVGAGDSATAGIVSSLCAGASIREAALIGNLVASITIQQIGVTGTASPEQVRRRLVEYNQQQADSRPEM